MVARRIIESSKYDVFYWKITEKISIDRATTNEEVLV